jgi:hypothetical protein
VSNNKKEIEAKKIIVTYIFKIDWKTRNNREVKEKSFNLFLAYVKNNNIFLVIMECE